MAKVSTNNVGSWFPTGYYGHYRSRVRTDFLNEYRQLAKPQPPNRFIHRASQPVTAHAFSLHDNKNASIVDASYFEQGLGRRRLPEKSGGFDPTFIAWCPNKINMKAGRPLTSTYRHDFRLEESNFQMLVKRPKTSFDGPPTTTYRTVHGADAPNRDLINAMNNEALMLTTQHRQRQARLRKSDYRESVASCLSWYRPKVPAATLYTNYTDIDLRPVQQANTCPISAGSTVENQDTSSPLETGAVVN
ncbi:hypothetical protein BgiMline_011982 [Biomphalaria glabrata]|uniref:Uncharacterized protein LOC106077901 n=1 Tax=Biomphalaria glabrata TaxID=6526 RepID=A0A9W3A843_BIOGL|nr:uncharacterized protein LOC106077901 [Biomphalaria glabrata]KAI8730957.1 cyclin-dependent kinase 12-like [Biomphalaria glabrata]